MRLRARFDVLGATVFTAAGVLPLACGGASKSEVGGSGNGGDQAAGHAGVGGGSGGTTTGTGGSSAGTRASVGGAGSSGTTGGIAGRSARGGSSGSAGSRATGGTPSVAGTGGSGGGAGGNGATGGASLAGASGEAGASSDNPFPCVAPQPLVAGSDTGFFVCQSGYTHREKVKSCPSNLPRPTVLPNPTDAGTNCTSDADCTEHPYGHCETATPPLLSNVCEYGCVEDSDCSTGSFCFCGADIGSCMTTTCTSDADCAPGFLCASYSLQCGTAFSCQAPGDECGSSSDCDARGVGLPRCSGPSPRTCASEFPCGTGRPFLVEGGARLALLGRRADWLEVDLTPKLAGLEPSLRERLAAEWSRAGLMEHASIAAFARFTLQLVSLGAPASLVELAAAAMSDETRHAKVCFALASAYAGSELGPGTLAVEDSLSDLSLTAIVLTTIREGCVGETIAAAEAIEASLHATDPVLRNALAAIGEDETRHAELAWRFVRFAVERGDTELRLAARREFDAIERELCAEPNTDASADAALLPHGVLTSSVRHAVRAGTLRQVILPAAKGLLAPRPPADETCFV